MKITSICNKTRNEDLVLLEKRLKAKLPKSFREFLLTYNLCKIEPNVFLIDSNKGDNVVRHFFGICPDYEWGDLQYAWISYSDRVPSNLLPIGTDEDDSLVCLSITGIDYGKVYFWDRHQEVLDRKPDYSNLHLLADSFNSFLDKLENYSQSHEWI